MLSCLLGSKTGTVVTKICLFVSLKENKVCNYRSLYIKSLTLQQLGLSTFFFTSTVVFRISSIWSMVMLPLKLLLPFSAKIEQFALSTNERVHSVVQIRGKITGVEPSEAVPFILLLWLCEPFDKLLPGNKGVVGGEVCANMGFIGLHYGAREDASIQGGGDDKVFFYSQPTYLQENNEKIYIYNK